MSASVCKQLRTRSESQSSRPLQRGLQQASEALLRWARCREGGYAGGVPGLEDFDR